MALATEYDFSALDSAGIPDWDDPIWYKPNGELHKLNHLWYRTDRITEIVLARLSDEEVRTLSCNGSKTVESSAYRKWHRIRTGEVPYMSAAWLDKFFVDINLPPFHTLLGAPDMVRSPGGRPPASGRPKLTANERFEIRRRCVAGERVSDLAREYGITERSIRRCR